MVKRLSLIVLLILGVIGSTAIPGGATTPITMWMPTGSGGLSEYYQLFADNYNKQNPDVELSIVTGTVTAWRDKLLVAFASGSAPDIVYEVSNMLGQWILSDVVTPLDKYLSQMPDIADFIPDVINLSRYHGQTIALPYAIWAFGDVYNMDHFVKKGVALPKTWADMQTAARKLLEMQDDGNIVTFGYKMHTGGQQTFNNLQLAMEQLGSTIIETDETKAFLHLDPARKGLEYLKNMWQAGMPGSTGGNQMVDIQTGKVAIQHMIEGISFASIADEVTGEVNPNFKFTRYVGPEEGKDLIHFQSAVLFLVSSSKHPDQAWKVMEAFVEPQNLKKYLIEYGMLMSVRKSQLNDWDLLSRPFGTFMAEALRPPMTMYGLSNPYYGVIRGNAGNILSLAVRNEMTIEEALEQSKTIIDTLIADRIKGK
jgi:ABC-type glycerol-3-phosphate transport system substrate-binding protein